MQVTADEGTLRVRLPVVPTEPFPGVVGVAVITPALGIAAVLGSELGWFGWLDPYVLGGTPIASLFLPLGWLVARGREQAIELCLEDCVWLVMGRERRRVPEASPIGLATNRLQLAGLDVPLLPLRADEIDALQVLLRGAGHTTHRVSERPRIERVVRQA